MKNHPPTLPPPAYRYPTRTPLTFDQIEGMEEHLLLTTHRVYLFTHEERDGRGYLSIFERNWEHDPETRRNL